MRWVIAIFALVLLALQLELWFSADRLPGLRQLERDIAAQNERNAALAQRNADYEAEIRSLKDGTDAAEERARSELGLVLPEETYFQFAQ